MKTVLFARVSTREQADEGYSLPAQEKLLKDYAEKNNLSVSKIFSVPESASGKQERKLFNELLEYIGKHHEVKTVICEKVDRITRNFKDAVILDDWLNDDPERQVHFVKQSLVLHKNAKSHEKFQWDINLALARQYSNNLSEEAKKGLIEKAAQGWFPGNHKLGYISVGDSGHKTWLLNSSTSEAKYITRAFELYNTGNYTLRTLAKVLFSEGWKDKNGKAIAVSQIHKTLCDPFYCGEFVWLGKKYQGKHLPLISKELYNSVQERLQRKLKAGKYKKRSYLLGSGLLVCGECGRTITAETQKGHVYYHCTRYGNKCNQSQYVREEELEKQVVDILGSVKIDNPRLLDWVQKALQDSHKDENQFHEDITIELEAEKKRIEKRLSTLYDDRVDERISKEFYEEKFRQYEQNLQDVMESITQHAQANIDYCKLGMNLFELAQKGRQIYQNAQSIEAKRELLNFVFSNLKLQDKNLIPTYKNGFDVIALRAKDGNWLGDQDSNLE